MTVYTHGHVHVSRLYCFAPLQDGETALYWASIMGHVEVAKVLLQREADVTLRIKVCILQCVDQCLVMVCSAQCVVFH